MPDRLLKFSPVHAGSALASWHVYRGNCYVGIINPAGERRRVWLLGTLVGSSMRGEGKARGCRVILWPRRQLGHAERSKRMDTTSGLVRDLLKPPLPGDVYQLGDSEFVTVMSVQVDEVRYARGVIEMSMFRDAPEELMRSSIVMPYKTFRKWLATIAAGHRVDTPPPS